MQILDLFRVVAVFHIGWDAGHRAGTVKRDHRDNVFQAGGFELGQHPLDPGAFQLEHPIGIPGGEHLIHRRVIVRQLIHRKIRLEFPNIVLTFLDDGQVAQSQKVHLQQAKLLNGGHGVLGNDHIIVALKRNVTIGGVPGNYHRRRMGGGIPRHPFQPHGRLQKGVGLGIGLIQSCQLFGLLQCFLDGNSQLPGHHFSNAVAGLVGQAGDPAHIPDHASGGHGAEGDNLSHMVGTVAAGDVINHFLTAFLAKVNVKVWHGHPLGIQKPFKQQLIPQRVDIGNADGVGGNAPGTRATPRSHRYVPAAGIADKIPDNQIVVHISHLSDDAQFIIQPLHRFFGRWVAVALLKSFLTDPAEKGFIILLPRHLKVWQFCDSKFKIKVTTGRNLYCILNGAGIFPQQRLHFIPGFHVKFLGRKFQRASLCHGGAGLDTNQHLLVCRFLLVKVMAVIGGHQFHPFFPGKLSQQRKNPLLLRNAVVLQFNEVILSEEVVVKGHCFPGFVHLAGQKIPGQFSGQAGGKADQTFMVLFQEGVVDSRLLVKALHIGDAHQFNQVLVALGVFAEQHQVEGVLVDAMNLIQVAAGRHIHLTPDDGLNALLFAGAVKLHRPVHAAVIGDGHGRLAQLFTALGQTFDAAVSIQEAVFGVQVKVYKIGHTLGCSSSRRESAIREIFCRR